MRARSGERFGDLGETIGAQTIWVVSDSAWPRRLASLGSPSFAFPPRWPMVAMELGLRQRKLCLLPASDASSGLAMGFAVRMSGAPSLQHTARSKLRTLDLGAPAAVWLT